MKVSISVTTLTKALGVALTGLGLMGPVDIYAAEIKIIDAKHNIVVAAPGQATGNQRYIVTFNEAGILNYDGGVSGLNSTAPRNIAGQRKLDAHTAAAQNYAAYLADHRATHVDAINSALHRVLSPTHVFAVTRNGIAVDLSADEASTVATVPGVKSVRVAGTQQLTTYRGPKFIGADKIWSGADTPTHVGTTGQGIVAGDLDGGSNSAHPSFADDANCGFRAVAPKLVAVDCSYTDINGYCHGPTPEATPGFGHGMHTSSTIAGNTINSGSSSPAPILPAGVNMSGVAPCAAIHQYKVCESDSCDGAAILAGVQNAIADQVDVLNFSISGGTDPWNDNDRDFLDAVNADIFVAAAAGNLQAGQTDPHGSVNHLGPWVMTVAASTQDQYIGAYMKVTGPGTVPAGIATIALTPGNTTPGGSIDQSGLPLISYPTNLIGCTANGGFPANYFLGAVAVIRRGTCTFTEKIINAVSAGATQVIIGNNAAGNINMNTTGAPAVPAFSIEGVTGDALMAFIAPLDPPAPPTDRIFSDGLEGAVLASGGGIGWYKHLIAGATQGDVLAFFSDRGPVDQDATKPDISAPGVNIYAASDIQDGNYAYMSGTSMATPHVTGAGALVRAVHPDWSVQEVKSALMMTATNTNGVEEDRVTPWIIDDVGSGRVDLTKAALAGLTMDETYANFVAANPDTTPPGQIKTLNLPELRDMACSISSGCSWTRTVRNRLGTAGTWNVTATSASTFAVTAVPATFTLAPGATQTITFTATPNASIPVVAFGMVSLTEASGQSPAQHITMAIRQPPPPNVACANNACSLQLDSYISGETVFDAIGRLPPSVFMWLNRFSPAPTDYPITLNTVQTAFGTTNTAVGDTFDVFIYQDNDSDPSNGAALVGSVLAQTITAPQNTLQTITIPGGLTLSGSGDILVALVTRQPSAYPASVDNGFAFQHRSWIGAVRAETVTNTPDLATLGFEPIDTLLPGFRFNWIIRAQGTNTSGPMTLSADGNGVNAGK
jgi:subtilisin family serine protease